MSEQEGRGLPEGEFARVMADIDKAAPLLRAISGKEQGGTSSRHKALLCALKPYLSPTRCEAADYLLRLWQMGELIKNMTREG